MAKYKKASNPELAKWMRLLGRSSAAQRHRSPKDYTRKVKHKGQNHGD